jgi:hypothetical protein
MWSRPYRSILIGIFRISDWLFIIFFITKAWNCSNNRYTALTESKTVANLGRCILLVLVLTSRLILDDEDGDVNMLGRT